ncbi:hypothetical protein Poli38472_012310 [Pythium oligandrum]|uniref:Uncharacterized protein n=1 Tax=Pythium oligandrum TaxID=41045 RepID=A0A8K1CPF8_PYTOL|nr:hypothetical protein Poli38472_012310 [Pythium oligandrum]|eukprot:TMW67194.1 hypothetical protein Poli38472_012310 [Pythium oligandrum]
MAPSPTKAVYVKSTVAVANGVEETNPEERTVVAGAQYRIRSTSTSSPSTRSFASRSLRLPAHLFVTVRRLFHPPTTAVPRLKPTFVLTSLLLGNEHNAANYDELYSLGVTHICNLDFNARNYFEGKFVYIKLNLVDRAEEDVVKHFDGVSQFLEACDAVGGRVLVHCCSGSALSPAFVIAYLMRKRKQTFGSTKLNC